MQVQGHRGSKGTHPENTLAAFMEAELSGATGIELDLQVTQEGVVVIHHDYFTKGSNKLIRDCPLKSLYSNDKESGISTLEELFLMLLKIRSRLFINLELKRDSGHPNWSIDPALFADKVISLVKRFNLENVVYYSSFDLVILEQIHIRAPKARLSYIVVAKIFDHLYPEELFKQIRGVGATIIAPEYTALNKELVEALRSAGLFIIAWTVNEPDQWQKLVDMGVDGIITDYPRRLVEFLGK